MRTSETDRLYLAVVSRDARFDGEFFTGVKTTGIYCRPICPARTPRRENVVFFPCAAAAEQAGFRPCKRCRPETAPGSPAWTGTASTVARALRLIESGALDRGSVDELAQRLGVGERHLRRLFDAHIGASPVAVAQTRRAHFARLLLDSSGLSISSIAEAAGYSSVRRFQTAFRATFGMPASQVRRGAGRSEEEAARSENGANGSHGNGGGVRVRLPARTPYDAFGTFDFLAPRAIPGVESVRDLEWSRAIRIGASSALLRARWNERAQSLDVHVAGAPGPELANVVDRVRRVFDLGADAARIAERLGEDRALSRSIRDRPGLRVPIAWDPFEACIRGVVGQQISVKAARTILGRIAQRWGERIEAGKDDAITHAFPAPDALAEARLDGVGLPAARARTIRELASRVAERRLVLDASAPPEALERSLLEIPGIGPWTVSYVRMRGLGDPDVFLPEDLGVRRALARRGKMPSAKVAKARAESWRPWRSYAVIHLWNGGFDDRARG
jgi:AraC family transcriptional regulator of adaptative response / DNA-3-methyladenine glycosylase II